MPGSQPRVLVTVEETQSMTIIYQQLIIPSSQINVDHDSRRALAEFIFPGLRNFKRRG